MRTRSLPALALLALVAVAACSSGGSKTTKADPTLGTRTLICTVSQKEHDTSGSSGAASYRNPGTGNYYIVFEAREGQATSRYRFEVTRQQYARYEEGDRVRLTLNNNILVNIQPSDD